MSWHTAHKRKQRNLNYEGINLIARCLGVLPSDTRKAIRLAYGRDRSRRAKYKTATDKGPF